VQQCALVSAMVLRIGTILNTYHIKWELPESDKVPIQILESTISVLSFTKHRVRRCVNCHSRCSIIKISHIGTEKKAFWTEFSGA
jgi:hypothetical protein